MTTALTPKDRESYARDGVIRLRSVVSDEWLETLRRGIEADLANPGPHVEIYTKGDDPGFFFNDFDMWRHIPEMRDFAFEGPLAAIAAALLNSRTIALFYDHTFVKEPGTEGLTHWHQDLPYMAVGGEQFCSSWLPLDPIDQSTTLEFIRGSHAWNRWFAPFDSMRDGSRHTSQEFERCPDIEADRAAYDIADWDMAPGDCLFFHGLIVHQGRNNPGKTKRRRIIAHRWLGDDTHFVLRDPPAEFPKSPTHLGDGDSYSEDPQFPRVYDTGAA